VTVALLSKGEFVVRHPRSASIAGFGGDYNNRVPRFADGGLVGGRRIIRTHVRRAQNTTIAPAIHVTVQGSPGATPGDHRRLAESIAKAAQDSLQQMVGQELRRQTRPGGLLRR
jgi:hypothetical protein